MENDRVELPADIRLELQLPRADDPAPNDVAIVAAAAAGPRRRRPRNTPAANMIAAARRRRFDRRLDRVKRPHDGTSHKMIHSWDFIVMTLDPERREQLINTFAKRDISTAGILLDENLEIIIEDMAELHITLDRVLECITEVGLGLRATPNVLRLCLMLPIAVTPALVAPLVTAVGPVNHLLLAIFGEDDLHMELLGLCLNDNPAAELTLVKPTGLQLRFICPAVHLMPNIKSFSIRSEPARERQKRLHRFSSNSKTLSYLEVFSASRPWKSSSLPA